MDSDQISGLVALVILLVLPVIMGLIAIIRARSLVLSQMHFLSRDNVEHLEPSDAAITRYRVIGAILIVMPITIILIGVLVSLNQRPW